MLNRILTFTVLFLVLAISVPTAFAKAPLPESELLPKAEVNDSGLHHQPWFHESFLNLPEDLAEAKAQGKRLAIYWEQLGCPYCKRMHEVNLRLPNVVDYIKKNFIVIQLNLWGDREVVDFDGEVTTEKKLAEKYVVRYTPTMSFFPETIEEMKGAPNPKDREVNRVSGYFKPFHFHFLHRYVVEKGYVELSNFQRWLGNIGRDLEAKGVHYDLWDDHLPPGLPEQYLK